MSCLIRIDQVTRFKQIILNTKINQYSFKTIVNIFYYHRERNQEGPWRLRLYNPQKTALNKNHGFMTLQPPSLFNTPLKLSVISLLYLIILFISILYL